MNNFYCGRPKKLALAKLSTNGNRALDVVLNALFPETAVNNSPEVNSSMDYSFDISNLTDIISPRKNNAYMSFDEGFAELKEKNFISALKRDKDHVCFTVTPEFKKTVLSANQNGGWQVYRITDSLSLNGSTQALFYELCGLAGFGQVELNVDRLSKIMDINSRPNRIKEALKKAIPQINEKTEYILFAEYLTNGTNNNGFNGVRLSIAKKNSSDVAVAPAEISIAQRFSNAGITISHDACHDIENFIKSKSLPDDDVDVRIEYIVANAKQNPSAYAKIIFSDSFTPPIKPTNKNNNCYIKKTGFNNYTERDRKMSEYEALEIRAIAECHLKSLEIGKRDGSLSEEEYLDLKNRIESALSKLSDEGSVLFDNVKRNNTSDALIRCRGEYEFPCPTEVSNVFQQPTTKVVGLRSKATWSG